MTEGQRVEGKVVCQRGRKNATVFREFIRPLSKSSLRGQSEVLWMLLSEIRMLVDVIIPTDSLLDASSRTFSLVFFVFDGHPTIPEGD